MIAFSAREGFMVPGAYTAFFVTLAEVGAVLSWRFLTPPPGEWRAQPSADHAGAAAAT